MCGLALKFEQLYKLKIDFLGVILGDGHGWKIALLVGIIELDDIFFHFGFVKFPVVVNIHLRMFKMYYMNFDDKFY